MTILVKRISEMQYMCVHGGLRLTAALAQRGSARVVDIGTGQTLEIYLVNGAMLVRSVEEAESITEAAKQVYEAAVAKAKASSRSAC